MKKLISVISVLVLWTSPALSQTYSYWLPEVVRTPTNTTYTFHTKVPDYMVPWILDTIHGGGQIETKEINGKPHKLVQQKFDWDDSCCSPSKNGQLSIGTKTGGMGKSWRNNPQLTKNTAVIAALETDKQTIKGSWQAVNILALKWDGTDSPNLVLVEPVSKANQAKARLRALAKKSTKPGIYYPKKVQVPSNIDAFRRDMLLIGNIGRRDPDFRKGKKNANNFSGNTVKIEGRSPESLVKNNSTPPYFFDLVLDDGLNKACQYMAEYYASTNGNERQPGGGAKHLGPKDYKGINMYDMGARLKHFAPGIASSGEGLGGPDRAGDRYPEGWMTSETHYRPWFNIGADVRTMGLGIAKTDKGWYACKISGKAPNGVAVTSPLPGTVPPKQQATGNPAGAVTNLSVRKQATQPSTAPEKSKCLFYEHFNYEGKSYALKKRDVLVTSKDVPSSMVYGIGGPVGERFVNKEWAGRVSSFRVSPNCEAIVTNGNKKVSIWNDVPQFSGEFNDKGIGFGCHCK